VVEVAPVIVAEAVQVEEAQVEEAVPTVALVEPVAELSTLAAQRTPTPPPTSDGRPAWAAEPSTLSALFAQVMPQCGR